MSCPADSYIYIYIYIYTYIHIYIYNIYTYTHTYICYEDAGRFIERKNINLLAENVCHFKPVFAKESGCSWLQQGAFRPIRKEIEVLLRKLARLHMAGRLIPVEQNKVNWMFHNLKYSKWTVTTNSLTELESKAKRKRHARLIL